MVSTLSNRSGEDLAGHIASMVTIYSPAPTKKCVIAFLRRVTSVPNNDNWSTGQTAENIAREIYLLCIMYYVLDIHGTGLLSVMVDGTIFINLRQQALMSIACYPYTCVKVISHWLTAICANRWIWTWCSKLWCRLSSRLHISFFLLFILTS